MLEIAVKDELAIYEEDCSQPISDLTSEDNYLYILVKLRGNDVWKLSCPATYKEEFGEDEVTHFIGPIDIVEPGSVIFDDLTFAK